MESQACDLNNSFEGIQTLKGLLSSNYNDTIPALTLRTISIAPMLDITNVHFRFLMRLLTRHAVLWTEMLHENAILNTKAGYQEFLRFNTIEHPVVVQLGGNTPESLAKCAKLCEEMGYDEINLNCGCPSPRVQEGAFGACLMKEPELVAECMTAMKKDIQIPVSIKTRLGVDNHDDYDFLKEFIHVTSLKSPVRHYVLHARKAYLKGLNPAENRSIPPLDYPRVLNLKKDFPHLEITINGGFKTIDNIKTILNPENDLTGCMVGRMAYENPWAIADIDRIFYGKKNLGYSRREILEKWADYGEIQREENPLIPVATLVKPIINLFANEKHNAKYRQFLSDPENFKKCGKSFRDYIYTCIDQVSKFNPIGLDALPPTDDPKITII